LSQLEKTNMAAVQHYDAAIIGAGQAGVPLARALAQSGRTTALIEREHVGGTCINEGCTPTKTMVASARVTYLARRGADYGVQTGPIALDLAKVRQRKRDIVASFRGGLERRLKQTDGLVLLAGEASFTAPKSLEVRLNAGDQVALTADLIFINTGARPARPSLTGLDEVPALNSTTVMELESVPEHLLVLGGGYIGLEFSQMFRRFGSRVTVVQRSSQLLGREDRDVAEAVTAILREDGVAVLLDTLALRVRPNRHEVELDVKTGEDERTLRGTHLLVAAGRTPNLQQLGLANAGIEVDKRGFIKVNERLETNLPGVYALGEVNGGPAFTHMAYDDFRIIRRNLLEGNPATTAGRLVPYTMFIDPQLARVGLSEQEARKQGRDIRVATMPMSYVARALEVDESRGFMKAVVDAPSKQILGFTILGLEGGELMAMVEIAMLGKLPYTVLQDAIFAHPTLAESLNNLFATIS
jgi:pyruvate/2-oxoglutarate dehydrogenase complex dihydrolipoamide dehydrogenase (E3) component